MQLTYNEVVLNIPTRYCISNLLDRFKNKTYEKEEIQLINKHIDQNDIVLELGACLGCTSILCAKKCKYVCSIEANPELYASLNQTKEDNGCSNVAFYNAIVDTINTQVEFYTYNLIVAGSADRDDKENPDKNNSWNDNIVKYQVQTKTIGEIEQEQNLKFNTLILDIEGGEYIFFTKHKEYIQQNINKIIVELHGRFMKDKDYNMKCIQLLQSINFKVQEHTHGTYYFVKV